VQAQTWNAHTWEHPCGESVDNRARGIRQNTRRELEVTHAVHAPDVQQ
jgi:hypothetical protein